MVIYKCCDRVACLSPFTMIMSSYQIIWRSIKAEMHPESENKPIYHVHLCRSVYAIVYGDNSTLRIRERYVATTSLPIISDQHKSVGCSGGWNLEFRGCYCSHVLVYCCIKTAVRLPSLFPMQVCWILILLTKIVNQHDQQLQTRSITTHQGTEWLALL